MLDRHAPVNASQAGPKKRRHLPLRAPPVPPRDRWTSFAADGIVAERRLAVPLIAPAFTEKAGVFGMPYESAPTLQTKEAIAYERLKMLILSGEIQKNEFLSQRALARHVDTNLTTLRTALRQLERDGLIENVPKWGVRVPLETEERLLDLYFMRELLETGAVRRIVKRRKEVDFATLAKKAEECDARARKLPKNIVEYSQSHFDFHMELARQSGSELLARSLRGIHFRSWLLWHDLRLWQQRDSSGHQRLVDVLAHARETEAGAGERPAKKCW